MLGALTALGAMGFAALFRLSYDLSFLFHHGSPPADVVLVYLDEESARELKQGVDQTWDRELHARLLNRLRVDGAKLVFYDIVFLQPSPEPATDLRFAEAMRAHGRVVLGAGLDRVVQGRSVRAEVQAPVEPLRSAAAGWGLLTFPYDPDFGARSLSLEMEDYPSASVTAAALVRPRPIVPEGKDLPARWLNYYGRAFTFPSVSFRQALAGDGIPPDFFKDKAVFIGGRPLTGGLAAGRDEFANPFSRMGEPFMPGLEVHATAYSNLVHGEWLERWPAWLEFLAMAGTGALFGLLAGSASPWRGLLGIALLAGAVTVGAYGATWGYHRWCNWLLPVLVQAPLAIVWCVSTPYFAEVRRRETLRRAFAFYMNEEMANQIARSNFDLKPGARLLEGTVLFADCQGSVTIAEELDDPLKLSELLIAYFARISHHVLEKDGIILKYLGDAVLALWGAPLPQADHAYQATCAAWLISEATRTPVLGRVITTRVGVSTGPMAIGNLGSEARFDFTAIGDTVNLGARLEGMNSILGTRVLISEPTQAGLRGRFLTRYLGHFAAAGKTQGVPVYEVLGPASSTEPAPEWLAIFGRALQALREGRFEDARKDFRETAWKRDGQDGPSSFYLHHMAALESAGALTMWTGVVDLKSK